MLLEWIRIISMKGKQQDFKLIPLALKEYINIAIQQNNETSNKMEIEGEAEESAKNKNLKKILNNYLNLIINSLPKFDDFSNLN